MALEQALAIGAHADRSSANSLTLCGPRARPPSPGRAVRVRQPAYAKRAPRRPAGTSAEGSSVYERPMGLATRSAAEGIPSLGARASGPRIGDLGPPHTAPEVLPPGGRSPPHSRAPREPIEGGLIRCFEQEDSLLIGEEYLVTVEAGSLGIERRSGFEQLADAVPHPCLERHDHH